MTYFKPYIFLLSIYFTLTSAVTLACSCPPSPILEVAYQHSELVIVGRIIGMDTIMSSNTLMTNSKGVKIGKRKYAPSVSKYVRVKMIIEQNFKTTTVFPDTVYVLTEVECGVFFTPYLGEGYVSNYFYEYIVYGNRWIEKSIEVVKKRRRFVGKENTIIRGDTFYTSSCGRTKRVDKVELEQLEKLAL